MDTQFTLRLRGTTDLADIAAIPRLDIVSWNLPYIQSG